MARGRMLNTTIAKDKQLNELSIEAEYIYLKTIPHLDRDGLINGDPDLLHADVCPRRKELNPRMQIIIDEIVASGLVIAYEDNGEVVLFFRGFSKNNTGMRYEREAASEFDPPPGYTRTNDGLVPTGSEGDSDKGKTRKGASPDKVPPKSGNCLAEDQDQIKDQDQRETTVREAVIAPNGNHASLSSSKPEYLPGLPDPRKRKGKATVVAERVMDANALGVDAEQFRLVVDALLDGFGKKPLADAGDERTLNYAQDVALIVMGISERFRTPAGIASIFQSWKGNDYRGDTIPTPEQLKEHASLMAAGKVICTRKDKSEQPQVPIHPTFKQWCLKNYGVDNPTFIPISESILRSRYEQSIRVH